MFLFLDFTIVTVAWCLYAVPTPVHAKFDLASGPSTVSSAMASFMCEGDTISGMSLNLTSAAYKVSLLKRKCLAGK